MLDKIKKFFKEVIKEGKKVDWPRKKEVINYTLIVIGISLSVALLLGLFDFIFIRILKQFIL